MKATTSINKAEITHGVAANIHSQGDTLQAPQVQIEVGASDTGRGKPESELQASARRHGLTVKELAARMGVNYSHLCAVANGRRPWTDSLRERVAAVLGEVPGQGTVHRQGGVVHGGESSYVRERAREKGLSLRQVADRTGLSYGYVVQVSRGQRHLSPAAQARMEAVLEAPVKVEAVQRPTVDPRTLWERMDALGLSQNEVARRVGISCSYLSQIMNGQRTPSGDVLRRLYEVLFRPSSEELVVPAEIKVLAWKKGGKSGVVVKGAGGPGSGTIRTGGRVPKGAEVEYAYRAGYDSRGRVSGTHLIDERGYGVMLNQRSRTTFRAMGTMSADSPHRIPGPKGVAAFTGENIRYK